MARLPVPGSDDGTWGDILNEYLTISHASDGTLKSGAVGPTSIQDDSITEAKLSPTGGSDGQVLTKNSLVSGGIAWATPASAADATTSSKGIVQLAGDLAGTAASPTVPGLANKANSSVTITAGTGLTGGGNLTTNRTLSANFGTTTGTIAEGDDNRITGAIQSTIVNAKGDLIVASAADTVVRVAVGSDNQVLTADSSQTSGVRWVTQSSSSASSQVYPIEEGYGYHSASISPDDATAASGIGGWHTRIWVPAGKAISTAAIFVTTAGVGTPTLAGFAVYTDDGQTKLGETTADNNIFASTGTRSGTFASPIAAQGSGRFVRVLFSQNYSTSGVSCTFATENGPGGGAAFNGGLAVRTAFFSALSSFPASFDPSTGSGLSGWTTTNYIPIILLG